MRQLLRGGEHEQRPDKSLKQSLHETVDRILGKGGQQGSGGMANALQQGNPGLFAAMDAPLRGLTPDDILFANEVDAALARRPKFGVRALSISVAAFFLCLIIWAAVASVDEVTHAEGSVVGSQRTQTIQNLEGGILRAVLVHEGQIVDKGAVLAQLDNEMAESAYRDAVNKAMREQNRPLLTISTLSPCSTRLTKQASIPAEPVPEMGNVTALRVLHTARSCSCRASITLMQSGSRCPRVGRLMLRACRFNRAARLQLQQGKRTGVVFAVRFHK